MFISKCSEMWKDTILDLPYNTEHSIYAWQSITCESMTNWIRISYFLLLWEIFCSFIDSSLGGNCDSIVWWLAVDFICMIDFSITITKLKSFSELIYRAAKLKTMYWTTKLENWNMPMKKKMSPEISSHICSLIFN